MNSKEKSDSGLAVALKIKAHCVLYFFSYKALSQIIQEGVETSCLGKGLLGEHYKRLPGASPQINSRALGPSLITRGADRDRKDVISQVSHSAW